VDIGYPSVVIAEAVGIQKRNHLRSPRIGDQHGITARRVVVMANAGELVDIH